MIRKPLVAWGKSVGTAEAWLQGRKYQKLRGNGRLVSKKAFRKEMCESVLLRGRWLLAGSAPFFLQGLRTRMLGVLTNKPLAENGFRLGKTWTIHYYLSK